MNTMQTVVKKYNLGVSGSEFKIEIPNTDRVDLAKLFFELGFKRGVEVGVERAMYSKVLCENNPQLKLYGVDPWEAYQGYREHVSQEKLDGFLEDVKDRMKNFNYEVVRQYSVDASRRFQDESLDFVYIDGNHEFSHVVADICAWYPKVRSGGIVSGHDFIRRRDPLLNMHVIEALEGFMKAYQLKPYFVMGRKDKLPGEKRDNTRSWFFVKE